MRTKLLVIVSLVLLGLLAAVACTPAAEPTQPAGLANPASEYCVDQSGTVVMQTLEDGGQYGVCTFEDNLQCEEWAMMRGDCPLGGVKVTGYVTDAARYCAITGGTYQVTDSSNTEEEQGNCTLPAGETCDVWAYYRGECTAETGYQPLDETACSDMANELAQATGAEVTTENADFDDYVANSSGTGCQATATGTGADFESAEAVVSNVGAALTSQGWEDDAQYAAGGPTGSAAAFRQGDDLCLLRVNWEPSPDANCPSDQPISACGLTPEQQLYTAVLNCAASASTSAN